MSTISPDKQDTAVVSAKVKSPLANSPTLQQTSIPTQVIYDKDEALCALHSKSIEAFCQEDSVLVCIDCILSNEHKGHTLHATDIAIDLQITYIGEQNEKAKSIAASLDKQKLELKDKLKSIIDSWINKKQEINELFTGIRQIINENEEKLLKEVDEKIESTNVMFNKKIKSFDSQEQSIELLQDMMNITIDEDIQSKLQFLSECKYRDSIIEAANKPTIPMKYPTPALKLRQDKEIDNIIKEIKQKPKAKRNPSVQAKPATITKSATVSNPATSAKATPSSSKAVDSKDSENFSRSVKSSKSKPIIDKADNIKSPKLDKNIKSDSSTKTEKAKNSQATRGSSFKGNIHKVICLSEALSQFR